MQTSLHDYPNPIHVKSIPFQIQVSCFHQHKLVHKESIESDRDTMAHSQMETLDGCPRLPLSRYLVNMLLVDRFQLKRIDISMHIM